MVFDTASVTVFILALARTSAWVAASPLFSANGIAGLGRLAFAISLALFAVPIGLAGAPPPTSALELAAIAIGQVALGIVLGWITGLALAIFQSAGAIVDLTSGFSAAAVLDPTMGTQSAVMSRLFGMSFLALFFGTNAHLVVVGGFIRSFEAMPATEVPVLDSSSVAVAATALSDLMLAALEISAPVLGALLLAEVGLALAARFAPQANIFLLGLPLKLLIALGVSGAALVFLPSYAENVVERVVELSGAAVR